MSYDDPTTRATPEVDGVGYTLRLQSTFSDRILVALVLRDGEVIGQIKCESKEEFEWLKNKLTGSKRLGL